MSAIEVQPAIGAGNYYSPGMQRVLAKLSAMGVDVPQGALDRCKKEDRGGNAGQFSELEYAVMDWFSERDYDQAQALIHFGEQSGEWHAIRLLDEDKCPRDLSDDMLCPSRVEAVAAVIQGCDREGVRLDACVQRGRNLIVSIAGSEALRIEPVTLQPFNREIRDRVRTALKGVRRVNTPALLKKVMNLPGFNLCSYDGLQPDVSERGCMFLGFPGNWVHAMRSALDQVGIGVKLSQSQELTAVLFGASNWQQLCRHQDRISNAVTPVSVRIDTSVGVNRFFFRTPEEAIFSVGAAIKMFPEPLVVVDFAPTSDDRRAYLALMSRREFDLAGRRKQETTPKRICSGDNDYWSKLDNEAESHVQAAKQLLDKIT